MSKKVTKKDTQHPRYDHHKEVGNSNAAGVKTEEERV
jgi:hypothetical protein